MTSNYPILYSFRRCPYAMRARMAVAVSGVQVVLREVVLREKPAHMLEISPKGTVPVLLLPDGSVIDESLDVMRWALKQSDPEGWISYSKEDLDKAQALLADCDGRFKHHLDRYKYASRYEGVEAEEHRDKAAFFLQALDEQLKEKACLLGQLPSIADYAIMPFIRQFANTDRAWFDAAPYPNLQKWLKTLLHSPRFLDVMQKYEQWQPESTQLLFPS